MEPLRGPRDRDQDLGGAFPYSRRLTRLMDKPLWGLRFLKFDGAIAPRVLKFDVPPARGLWWAPYIYRRRPLMIKPSQPGFRPWENRPTSLRSRKCIPPLVAGATTFTPLRGGTITRAYCRAIYEESVSRCFILPPEQGWQGNTSHTSEHILKERQRCTNHSESFHL